MRIPISTLVAIVSSALLVSGASATESTIYPGVGIGKVKLGMTATQVKKALGADNLVNGTKTIAARRYVEYGWNFSSWTATFAQRGRKLIAVQVTTDVHDQKTKNDIGYGTFWHKLVSTYPGGRCGFGSRYSNGLYLEYLVGHTGGTQTMYTLTNLTKGVPPRTVNYKVVEVLVRVPFEPLPEFSPHPPLYRCSDDWRTTNAPQFIRA